MRGRARRARSRSSSHRASVDRRPARLLLCVAAANAPSTPSSPCPITRIRDSAPARSAAATKSRPDRIGGASVGRRVERQDQARRCRCSAYSRLRRRKAWLPSGRLATRRGPGQCQARGWAWQEHSSRRRGSCRRARRRSRRRGGLDNGGVTRARADANYDGVSAAARIQAGDLAIGRERLYLGRYEQDRTVASVRPDIICGRNADREHERSYATGTRRARTGRGRRGGRHPSQRGLLAHYGLKRALAFLARAQRE